jgi:Cd(II)/Pb(II)-responsive transcriptional regulator
MKIGELAQATGCQAETIRYYEREGLLARAARTDSNYRVYGPAHVRRLAFIRHCRSLDMTLEEIRTLLRFKDEPSENCEGVNELLDEHIAHVTARIKELRALQAELRTLRDECGASREAACCGILSGLDRASLDSTSAAVPGEQFAHPRGAHRKIG